MNGGDRTTKLVGDTWVRTFENREGQWLVGNTVSDLNSQVRRPKPLTPNNNPAHIRGAGNVKRAHKVKPASLSELETIVAALPYRDQLMALLAARFGELTELRRGDIDLRTKRVSITRGVVRAGGEFVVGQPKSDAGVRDVAIPPH